MSSASWSSGLIGSARRRHYRRPGQPAACGRRSGPGVGRPRRPGRTSLPPACQFPLGLVSFIVTSMRRSSASAARCSRPLWYWVDARTGSTSGLCDVDSLPRGARAGADRRAAGPRSLGTSLDGMGLAHGALGAAAARAPSPTPSSRRRWSTLRRAQASDHRRGRRRAPPHRARPPRRRAAAPRRPGPQARHGRASAPDDDAGRAWRCVRRGAARRPGGPRGAARPRPRHPSGRPHRPRARRRARGARGARDGAGGGRRRCPTARLPAPVEAAAYFVVAECLTNVGKYAQATVGDASRVRPDGGRLVVEVGDDGVGGADAARGSGLRGLADRVGALERPPATSPARPATGRGCGPRSRSSAASPSTAVALAQLPRLARRLRRRDLPVGRRAACRSARRCRGAARAGRRAPA